MVGSRGGAEGVGRREGGDGGFVEGEGRVGVVCHHTMPRLDLALNPMHSRIRSKSIRRVQEYTLTEVATPSHQK